MKLGVCWGQLRNNCLLGLKYGKERHKRSLAACPERLLNQRSLNRKLKIATCAPVQCHVRFITYCALEYWLA